MILVALDNSIPTSRNYLSWEHGLATAVTAGTTNIIVCVPFVPTWATITVLLILVYSVVIVWDNGRFGFHGEHSCLDGIPTLRMNESMLGSLDANEIYLGNPLPSISLTPPKEIILTADDAVHADIQDAMRNFGKLVDAHELRVLHYDAYGKDFIKQFKISPDAWAQLVNQLAFYKLKGRPGVTYESAQTRKFQPGRTEVVRRARRARPGWA